jgi:hypothetical protein
VQQQQMRTWWVPTWVFRVGVDRVAWLLRLAGPPSALTTSQQQSFQTIQTNHSISLMLRGATTADVHTWWVPSWVARVRVYWGAWLLRLAWPVGACATSQHTNIQNHTNQLQYFSERNNNSRCAHLVGSILACQG